MLWELGIAATTTIGGSGAYNEYGNYQEDLAGARLVLAPDRDRNGLKYIANIERDFSSQIEGYYLAGTQGLWRNPQGGMDIGDDIRDNSYTNEQILDRIITPIVLVEFRTQRHERLRLLIPCIALVGDGLDALREIVDRGYYYNLSCKKLLLAYLFGLGGDVDRVYTIADKTGWVNGSFITPAKTYGDPDLRFREPELDNSPIEMKGTLANWKSDIAAKCAGNSRLLFALGTAFAASLLPLAQIESGGFHLVGSTSIGKNTALNVAASVAGLKTIPNWRSTANALEGKASEFNHLLLPLDEIGQADPQTVGASAYMLGNGQGKNRMAKTLGTHPIESMSVICWLITHIPHFRKVVQTKPSFTLLLSTSFDW